MTSNKMLDFYRKLYAGLVRLYPMKFYLKFGQEMELIFDDLLEEKLNSKISLHRLVWWVYLETFINIVKENLNFYIMKPFVFIRVGLITSLILLIPLVAMQISDSMNWTAFDFAFAGIVLFLAGLSLEFFFARTSSIYYRSAAALAVFTSVLLIWAAGAVGIVGSESEPINLRYFGVPLITIIGSVISSLKPKAMAYTMFASALTQGVITLTALGLNIANPIEILGVNGFFIALYLTSAVLFLKSEKIGTSKPFKQAV